MSSERMNKERAREIINTEVIETLKSHQQMSACFDYDDDGNAKPNNNYAYYDELLQALDIAIESLDENERLKKERDYILEKAKAELKDNEWVDVKDRLPSESGWYLVTEYAPSEFITNIREFNLKHFVTDYAQVIAWKPLPQPYERKE